MTRLEPQHSYRATLTRCPRCEGQPGSRAWGPTWLHELTISDGLQSVHALLCRRPSCDFAEIRGLLAAPAVIARRRWVADIVRQHPFTFAAAALVHGAVLGVLVLLL
jgi:hypothetical protein